MHHGEMRNGLATSGLVLGIIGVVPFPLTGWFSILAIIFGAIGRGRVKRGEASNMGVATSALVLGIIGAVLQVLIYAGLGATGNL